MNSYLANIDQYYQQQEQMQQDADGHFDNPENVLKNEQPATKLNYSGRPWMQDACITSSNALPVHPMDSDRNIFIPNSSQPFAQNMSSNFVNQDYTQQSTPQPISQPTSRQTDPIVNPTFDINGQPVRIRKKPGRKPNPASPALRKAQNRAAQRAFRERKEKHLHDLESTIRTLREQKNTVTRENKELKENIESYKAETWYLKGIVLTLQFMCMHHNIRIPTHSPYFSRDALEKMAQSAPHMIDAYINAYTKNNESLKSTKYYHHLDKTNFHQTKESFENAETANSEPIDSKPIDSEICHYTDHKNRSKLQRLENRLTYPTNNINAIENIRQKLGFTITYKMNEESSARLRPTLLQLAIPHDSRIDLIPTPHTRDRMIIFRDQMDIERCFSMLLNGSTYHGGDPTESGSWELPAEFFNEFWYLTINYDVSTTNKWRRLRGLQEIYPGFTTSSQNNDTVSPWPPSTSNSVLFGFDREMYGEIVENMPVLQPYSQIDYPLAPSRHLDINLMTNSNTIENSKNSHQNMMCAPESRRSMNTSSNLGSF